MAANSLTILGSSSGMPQARRATAGYLLRVNDRSTLIDCGGGICSSFLRCGFDPVSLERIVISHTHSDHVCELPLMIQMVYLAGLKDKLDVYVPSEFVQPLSVFLPAVYLLEEKLPFALNVIGYDGGGDVVSADITLTAIANRHLHGYAEYIKQLNLPNKMQCHSFLIEVNGRSLLYSSDISSLDDVKEYLDGRDYVIIESTHIDLDQFFTLAQTINVGRYVITHLGTEDDIGGIVQGAQKAGIENLVIAEEGMELPL